MKGERKKMKGNKGAPGANHPELSDRRTILWGQGLGLQIR